MSRIFLDSAGGQPLSEVAFETFRRASELGWASPVGLTHEAKQAAAILHAARETVANVAGCQPTQVLFLPSCIAPRLLMEMLTMRTTNSGQVIVSATERDVLQSAALDTFPQVRTIPVDSHGQVDGEKLASSATSAALAIIQAGNLEIGTRQRLELLADALGNTAWLCDVSGIMGFTDVPNQPTAVFADAHTFGGPAEVSIAIVDGALTQTMQPEVSVVSAAVAAAALYDVAQRRDVLLSTFTELSEHLREFVATHIADVDVLGDPVHRLPQVSAFSFLYVDAERLANDLDRAGFAIGSGSACASRFGMPSHVLRAIGALTHGNVRIGLPLSASLGQVDEFLPVLRKCVQQNRSEA